MGSTYLRCLPGQRVKERPTEPALDASRPNPWCAVRDGRRRVGRQLREDGRGARDAGVAGPAVGGLAANVVDSWPFTGAHGAR
jgi:hypothetical protein